MWSTGRWRVMKSARQTLNNTSGCASVCRLLCVLTQRVSPGLCAVERLCQISPPGAARSPPPRRFICRPLWRLTRDSAGLRSAPVTQILSSASEKRTWHKSCRWRRERLHKQCELERVLFQEEVYLLHNASKYGQNWRVISQNWQNKSSYELKATVLNHHLVAGRRTALVSKSKNCFHIHGSGPECNIRKEKVQVSLFTQTQEGVWCDTMSSAGN